MKLVANPYKGYKFKSWSSTSLGVNVSDSGQFVMMSHSAEITATFEPYDYNAYPNWGSGKSFVASWTEYEGCTGYSLTLYKKGSGEGTHQEIGSYPVHFGTVTSYDFSDIVRANGEGTYFYSVKARFMSGPDTDGNLSLDKTYEISTIGDINFSFNSSNDIKLTAGDTVSEALSKLTGLNSEGKLISGLNDNVTLAGLKITSDTTLGSENGYSNVIEENRNYYLCFGFNPKYLGDKYNSEVTGPSGATVLRSGDTACYIFYPIEVAAASGPEPGGSPLGGPEPGSTPGPEPTPDPEPAPSDNAPSAYELATELIDTAKAGDTVTYDFGDWHSLPLGFMEKVASRPDLTYVFKCVYQSEHYEFTINPGTKFELDCLWYGPLKMAELFNTKITDESGNVKSVNDAQITGNGVYLIQSGDTLSMLAARFKRTIEELLILNSDITDSDSIVAGKILQY